MWQGSAAGEFRQHPDRLAAFVRGIGEVVPRLGALEKAPRACAFEPVEVLGDPGELSMTTKPIPAPSRAEVLVRIDAIAVCATDLRADRTCAIDSDSRNATCARQSGCRG